MKKVLSLNEMANTGNKWAVVSFNETDNWDDVIAKKAKRIDGVYLVNLKMPTHLCELSVSYPAIWMKNYFHSIEGFDEDEITRLELQEDGGEKYPYFSGNSRPKFHRYFKKGKEDDILESKMCNPTVC